MCVVTGRDRGPPPLDLHGEGGFPRHRRFCDGSRRKLLMVGSVARTYYFINEGPSRGHFRPANADGSVSDAAIEIILLREGGLGGSGIASGGFQRAGG
jgi:hypothetical protein